MIDLLLTALAAWRIASLLVDEAGPWGVFSRLRYRAGVRGIVVMDPAGKPTAARTAQGWLAEGLTCVWCVSVWAAMLLVGLDVMSTSLGVGWVYAAGRLVLAASAGAILVHQTIERLR